MSTSMEILENVWNANPGGLVFAQYAKSLLDAGRARDAQTILTRGLEKWPRHFTGRLLLGSVNQELGDLEAARAAFQEAVSLDSRSPAALRGLAIVLGKQQYQRQAIDHWVRLSLLDPEDREAASMARKMIADLETTSSLADLGLGIRDIEDAASREALSEGASSQEASRGIASDSPLAGWPSETPVPVAEPVFDLGDLAIPVAPSVAAPSAWSAEGGMDSTIAQVPVQASSQPAPVEPIRMAPNEDSAFATIEMASFPAHTIPPPPLEIARPGALAGNSSDTRLLNVVQNPDLQALENTQLMPRPQEASPVTGDDIGNRLDDIFGETTEAPPAFDAMAGTLPPPPSVVPATNADAPTAGAIVTGNVAAARVTGEDIEDRLSELFGNTPSDVGADLLPPPPVAIQRPSVPPPSTGVTGDDVEARLDDLFGQSSIDIPVVQEDVPKPTVVSGAPVRGEDIEDRLDALFGKDDSATIATPHDISGEETSAMERTGLLDETSEHAAATIENMRTFQDVAVEKPFGAIDPSDVDSGGSTIDLPTVDVLNTVSPGAEGQKIAGKDLDSQLDELFASSEFLMEQAPPPAPRKSVVDANVTGNDIENRLDDLFGNDSDFPAGVPTVTLAEEYLRQGYRDQATAVYRQLVAREPGNAEFARRLAQIEAGES